jgi:hypothetical protein
VGIGGAAFGGRFFWPTRVPSGLYKMRLAMFDFKDMASLGMRPNVMGNLFITKILGQVTKCTSAQMSV